MYTVELYLRVRLACHVDGLSQREAASRFGLARETVKKMLRHSEPPGYRRRQPPKRPKLDPFTDVIDRILEDDRTVHRKQRHTAKRVFERLRDEHDFAGGQTIVKDYVRERRRRSREMFVPLVHPPGHAQADFGEADAIIAGVRYRAHFFTAAHCYDASAQRRLLCLRLPGGDSGSLAGLWWQDEARIGQKNKLTRRWARRGTRPRAPRDQRTEWAYIFGAICPAKGKGAGLVMPWCDTDAMSSRSVPPSIPAPMRC